MSGDDFLLSLADGGYQVGELAKHYFPGGILIGRDRPGDAAVKTAEFLSSGDIILYESAFRVESFFIFADIVSLSGNVLNLYEVKAKSFDPTKDDFLNTTRDKIRSEWQQYIYDVTYQKFVIQLAYPDLEVRAHLVLADKTSKCPTDGLNQKFRVRRLSSGRMQIDTSELTADDLSQQILCVQNVDGICTEILNGGLFDDDAGMTFAGRAYAIAEINASGRKFPPIAAARCGKCQFVADETDLRAGKQSGFRECWAELFGWSDENFAKQSVLDIWDFRGKDKLIKQGRVRINDVTDDDLNMKDDDKPGISRTRRQLLQVDKAKKGDSAYFLDANGLRNEFEKWRFPLHFIDFETSMPAIPFKAGRSPYEGIAFQFSHHIVDEHGLVEHKTEFISTDPGVFPSYDFVRALKSALSGDEGTIFRYAAHENSYLNLIYEQMVADPNIPDVDELTAFIRSISTSVAGSSDEWEGPRNMVDLLELEKRFYFDPSTRGSNSIKKVLPAILNSSDFLKEKYSKPIYGAEGGIFSHNFRDWTWVQFENGRVIDPYKLLPGLFNDLSGEDLDSLFSGLDEMKDGGAALTAYAKLQFEEMPDAERQAIIQGLLKYCELDTLAMVMIYEGWREMIK
ncbi:MAG: DUF2779 domain-containing protein [Acidobacteriota bacterium]